MSTKKVDDFPQELVLEIKQEDIVGALRSSAMSCPVSRAVLRTLGLEAKSVVTCDNMVHIYGKCRLLTIYSLPADMDRHIKNYDNGGEFHERKIVLIRK